MPNSTGQQNYILSLIGRYLGLSTDLPPLASITEQQAQTVYRGGLSQVALACYGETGNELRGPHYRLFHSADMTARVIDRQLRDAVVQILDTAAEIGVEVVLLKGIAVSGYLYRLPHHRTMGDVDLLVRPRDAERLQGALVSQGYMLSKSPGGRRRDEQHHHLPVLRHPSSDVPIEVHNALFSRTLITSEPLFDHATLWRYTEKSEFAGRPCRRFVPEFQLLYAVAHWAIDNKWPVNLVSICDIALMLEHRDPAVDWEIVRAWTNDNRLTGNMLAVILLFFEINGLTTIPGALAADVEKHARFTGGSNLRILHWLLTTFPISGRNKVGWAITSGNARILWLTLLEPRHRLLRLPIAASRVIFRRTRGRSLLGSAAGRMRTLLQPND